MRYLLIVTLSHYHFPALLALKLSHVLYLQVSFIIDREKQRFQAIFLSQQSSEALEAIWQLESSAILHYYRFVSKTVFDILFIQGFFFLKDNNEKNHDLNEHVFISFEQSINNTSYVQMFYKNVKCQ